MKRVVFLSILSADLFFSSTMTLTFMIWSEENACFICVSKQRVELNEVQRYSMSTFTHKGLYLAVDEEAWTLLYLYTIKHLHY